jgi:hypothetical protein
MAGGQAGMELPVEDLVALLPLNMVGSLAAEPDRATLEFVVTPGEGTPMSVVGDSELAGLFPAETQVYVETREMGAAIETGLTGLVDLLAAQAGDVGGDVGMGDMGDLSDIDMLFGEESPITSMLGGVALPEYLDFVGDAALGSGWSSDGLWIGIATEVNDEEAADERITTLMTLLQFIQAANSSQASSAGDADSSAPDISVTKETVDGTQVWAVTVPIDEMTAGSSIVPELGDTISVAVANGNLLIGTGDFVQAALGSDGTASLATSPGYVDAIAGDTVNSGVMYMDIGSMLSTLGPELSTMAPEWEAIAPYTEGLDRMFVVGTVDDDVMRSRMTLTVMPLSVNQ